MVTGSDSESLLWINDAWRHGHESAEPLMGDYAIPADTHRVATLPL